jgi:hypothetical protein
LTESIDGDAVLFYSVRPPVVTHDLSRPLRLPSTPREYGVKTVALRATGYLAELKTRLVGLMLTSGSCVNPDAGLAEQVEVRGLGGPVADQEEECGSQKTLQRRRKVSLQVCASVVHYAIMISGRYWGMARVTTIFRKWLCLRLG